MEPSQILQLVMQGGALGILAVLILYSMPRAVDRVCKTQEIYLTGFKEEMAAEREICRTEMGKVREDVRALADRLGR